MLEENQIQICVAKGFIDNNFMPTKEGLKKFVNHKRQNPMFEDFDKTTTVICHAMQGLYEANKEEL